MAAPLNSFKVTVVVESVVALSQLDEIVFALRERIVGLNAGKWNYLSSIVKRYRNQPQSMIEPRHLIKPYAPYLASLMLQVVHTAHRRGIHAIGGASEHVPRINQPKATQVAKLNLIEEKLLEAELGFDGSWVVHPLLVETGRKCFQTVIVSAVN